MKVPASKQIPETWYRPELEDFDVNYNRNHAHKVATVSWATLETEKKPWKASCIPTHAVITAETLYFPQVVAELSKAAIAGA